MNEDGLSLRDVSRVLGVQGATLRAQIARGRLHAQRRGRDWYVPNSEVARYQREVQGRRGRPPAAPAAAFELIADYFEHHAEWPRTDWLQRQLVLQGIDLDLGRFGRSLDPAIGRIEPGGAASMSIRGLSRAGARETLRDFEAALDLAVKRYRDPGIDSPSISSGDFRGLDSHRRTRLRLLLTSSGYVTGGGQAAGGDWSYRVSDSIHLLGEISTVSAYLVALDRLVSPSVVSDTGPVTDWTDVESRLAELLVRVRIATSVDDRQDIGRRSRDLVKGVADALTENDPTLSAVGADPKARITAFLTARAPGNAAADLRTIVVDAVRLANHVTHDPAPSRAEVIAAAQGAVLVVRTIAAITSDTDR